MQQQERNLIQYDQTINVASRELTRQMLMTHNARRRKLIPKAHHKHFQQNPPKHFQDMAPDGRTEEGRTDGQRQNKTPPPMAGDKKKPHLPAMVTSNPTHMLPGMDIKPKSTR
ncbi:hypothetical protein DPMN_090004 [Dreissena polymorpha]|uniref:Uncharacterized protein n=1 Tax=Dreissena polymorpha TaxID=45954 RepID=A0A9D4KWX8_DREPO|nr:hypothetical protein DPMN_090004 [Dreissena polymorpha]